VYHLVASSEPTGLAEDSGHVVGVARRLLHHFGEVLAEAVVRHPARDGDARLGDVGELDRVVRLRPDRGAEVLADLGHVHVECGGEFDVADVIPAEIDVHEPGDELARVGVLVVLDALKE
jgi:hypothetical protein